MDVGRAKTPEGLVAEYQPRKLIDAPAVIVALVCGYSCRSFGLRPAVEHIAIFDVIHERDSKATGIRNPSHGQTDEGSRASVRRKEVGHGVKIRVIRGDGFTGAMETHDLR